MQFYHLPLLSLVVSTEAFVAPCPSLQRLKTPSALVTSAPTSSKTKLDVATIEKPPVAASKVEWNVATLRNVFVGNWATPKSKEATMIKPSQRLAVFFTMLGASLTAAPSARWAAGTVPSSVLAVSRWGLGVPSVLFGLLLAKQTRRVRLVFDENNRFCLKTRKNGEDYDQDVGRNMVTGTPSSSWDVDSIVNYDFFPSRGIFNPKGGWIGPIICYFKERETPRSVWSTGLGGECNDPEKIARHEAIAGQAHFLPALFNTRQLCKEFEQRGCGKLAQHQAFLKKQEMRKNKKGMNYP